MKMAGSRSSRVPLNQVTSKPGTWLGIFILVFIVYAESNVVGQSIVSLTTEDNRVSEGDPAILQCYFSPDNAVIGKWYWKKNGIIIARSDQLNTSSRYSLANATSGNISLIIKSALRLDTDTFICGVNDQSTGSTVSHSEDCKLTVNYLDNPIIKTLTDTRITEGTRVSMSCNLESSYPEVETITWIHENKIIDTASRKYIVNDDILEIKKFDQSDEGNYSCRAENVFFANDNGKYSNSVSFSLKAEDTSPASQSSNSWKWAFIFFFFFAIVLIIVVVLLARNIRKKDLEIERHINDAIKSVISKGVEKIQLTGTTADLEKDVIYRRALKQRSVISPVGLVLGDHVAYAFANVNVDNAVSHYIMRAGELHMKNEKMTVTWDENADILLKPDERRLSFVALPGIRHPYIFLKFINVYQDGRLQEKLVTFLPDGTFSLMNNIVKTLTSQGPIEDIQFDHFSGKKLSNGRLVVGGWVKRRKCVGENRQPDVWNTVEYCESASTESRLMMGVENQSFDYQPFIMWTDNEINWNLGENLKIEKAEDNMRIQLTETSSGGVYMIISSESKSKKVLYEGNSKDYCRTFEERKRDQCFQLPVVSFALSVTGSLVGARSVTFKKTKGSSENAKEEDSPGTSGLASVVPIIDSQSSLKYIQGKWEGLWHLVQDTTTNKAIRLKPVRDHTESSDNRFVTILENGSGLQCDQILPFAYEDQYFLFMIYTTQDEEDDHGGCTKYHMFSLESLGFKDEVKK